MVANMVISAPIALRPKRRYLGAMRWAFLAIVLAACSGATTALNDAGDPSDATVDAPSDHVLGNPLDAQNDVNDASVADVVPPEAASDASVDAIADVTDASALAFDLDALAYCTQWSCQWSSVWSPQVQRPPNYVCVRCTDNGTCNPQPWANGCDAGTVYDPVISPYDGSSSVLDFCVPESCPPK
jgi:hypothetical protein